MSSVGNRNLSVARKALDEIEERTKSYIASGYEYLIASTKANAEIKEKYSEFDTRVVEKAEGS